MVWCFLAPAALCAGLGLTALVLDLRRLRGPRLSPGHVLRGCLAGSLFVVAGLLAALAFSVAQWAA